MASGSDYIGNLGETYFCVSMLNHRLFRPAYLGEKWPVSDYFVEIVNSEEQYFFIVQVKSSAAQVGKSSPLPIAINQEKLRRLASYGAPTYLAFVDVNSGNVYLKAAMSVGQYASRKAVIITEMSSIELRDEVIAFWKSSGMSIHKEQFKSAFQ